MVTTKRPSHGGVGRVAVATLPSQYVLVSLLAAMVSYTVGYDRGLSAASAGIGRSGRAACMSMCGDDVPGGRGLRAGRAQAAMEQLVGDGSVAYPRLHRMAPIWSPDV